VGLASPVAERVPGAGGREKQRDEGSVLRSVKADLTSPGALALVSEGVDVVFHLAAIGPDAAEKDFDLGMKVNFDATRSLLTRCRRLEVRVRQHSAAPPYPCLLCSRYTMWVMVFSPYSR
jgi:nucleoside-diphosphate-sugar epimerase